MKKRSKVERRPADRAGTQSRLPPADTAASWKEKLRPNAGAIFFFVAACIVCIGFTLYTDQIFEDSLITLRHSENLLKGNGLTYNPGTRVHGFTSPINVLLLTVCSFLTGQSSYVAAFWLYRLFTIPAFAASCVLLLKAFHDTAPRWAPATWFVGIVYLFDVKMVAFSTNGMETAFMLLFVAWAVYLMSRAAPEQWLMRGLCWGGLMWSRPDGCVYIAAFALAEWIFLTASRRSTFISLAKSAVVCAIVYAPWFVWAWAYYGSPIPHTVTAKATVEWGPLGQLWATMNDYFLGLLFQSVKVFRPIYYNPIPDWFGPGGELALDGLTRFVSVVALLYFTYPVRDRFGRAMSLCFFILCSYFTYIGKSFPWYFPPATLLGAIAFARAGMTLAFGAKDAISIPAFRLRKSFVLGAFIVLAVGQIFLFGPASLQQRIFQTEIEMGNRAEIGKWLKENASPSQNVYLEPLGYIGYFSGMHINDYPGLVSPEVVQIRRQLPAEPQTVNMARLLVIPHLKPDWVVLRLREYLVLSRLPIFEDFKANYVRFREFNAEAKLNQYRYLPGKGFLLYDANFAVFRRASSGN